MSHGRSSITTVVSNCKSVVERIWDRLWNIEYLPTFMYFALAFFLMRKLSSPAIGKSSFRLQLKKSDEPNARDNLSFGWAGKLPGSAQEILDIMNFPEVYSHFSSQLPKGLLLHGLPGTGKTHYARIICEAARAQFFYASAAEFDELYVGVGSQRVRALFESAEQATQHTKYEQLMAYLNGEPLPQKKAVIFIDELDALGSRNNSMVTSSATHSTVSQLLTCLDGIAGRDNVFIIAATNNIANIDPALRRSGRFDRVVTMSLPDKDSRAELITYYLNNQPGTLELVSSGFVDKLADLTEGFSAADMKNLINEATVTAIQETIARRKKKDGRVGPVLPSECQLGRNHVLKALLNLHEKLLEERKALVGKYSNEAKLLASNVLRQRCGPLFTVSEEEVGDVD